MSVGEYLRVGLGAGRRRAMVTARPVRYVAGVALIAIGYDLFAQGGEALLLTAPAVAVVAAVLATSNALGPFVEQAASDSALNLQLYIVFAALTTLCLAAIVCERRRVARELSESRTRIAAARERERRRLEGELHDSAQNRIFAPPSASRLGTVRSPWPSWPATSD